MKPDKSSKNTAIVTLAYCDLWRHGVLFAVGPVDLVASHVKKRYGVELPPSVLDEMNALRETGGLAITAVASSTNDILIWAPEPIPVASLVHECVHAATFLLKYVGADNSDEARAYTTEFLFERFAAVTSCVSRQSLSPGGVSSPKAERIARSGRRARAGSTPPSVASAS